MEIAGVPKAEWNAANHLYHHRGESDPYDGETIDALDGAPEPGEVSLTGRFRAAISAGRTSSAR